MTRYGLFEYSTSNLGDEIQSIAASQFLPRIDEFVDRDQTSAFRSQHGGRVKLIMNGWHSHAPENWPPSDDIDPIFISVHLNSYYRSQRGNLPSELMLSGAGLEYFRRHAPVGVRDLTTLEAFRAAGVEAYFSGCLTLTLRRPNIERDPDLILLNGVADEVRAKIADATGGRKRIQIVSQLTTLSSRSKRFRAALALLEIYARASFVVTSKLHCAMPSLAFGTPVVLITSAADKTRFAGLGDFLRLASPQAFLRNPLPPIDPPLPNKPDFLLARERLSRAAIDFVGADCWSVDGGQFNKLRAVIG